MEQRLNFFLVTKKQFESARPPNNPASVSWSFPAQIKEDATMTIEKLINLLQCGGVLISWKVMQIAQIPSLGVLWRGRLGSPVSFVGVLQRVMAIFPAMA
jgi:hypothetical protein